MISPSSWTWTFVSRWTNHDWLDANIKANTAAEHTHKEDTNSRWHVSPAPVWRIFSRGNISRRGVMRLVNRGFDYSETFSPHLCPECTGLAFQTLSPVTRETLAALESTAPCRHHSPRHPPPTTPPLQRHHTRPWKSCLEREDEESPSGRLRPLAGRHPYCLVALNWFEGCEIISIP